MTHTLAIFFFSLLHPFYVSVTTIDYDSKNQLMEISCRIFFDDLENALAKENSERVSLLKPVDRKKADQYLATYLGKNLHIKIDGINKPLRYIGYEIEEDAAWCYLEIPAVPKVHQLQVWNSILYRSHDNESNIMHITINGKRESIKLDNPKASASFSF